MAGARLVGLAPAAAGRGLELAVNPDELLERIAATLRTEVGPAVDGEYPKTQAFMAAVVLEKLARQLRASTEHELADRAEREAMFAELTGLLSDEAPQPVVGALAEAEATGDDAELCRLIEVLYAARDELGADRFAAALARIRRALRARIDRRMEVAR